MINLNKEVPYYTLLRQHHQWGKSDFFNQWCGQVSSATNHGQTKSISEVAIGTKFKKNFFSRKKFEVLLEVGVAKLNRKSATVISFWFWNLLALVSWTLWWLVSAQLTCQNQIKACWGFSDSCSKTRLFSYWVKTMDVYLNGHPRINRNSILLVF